MPRTSATLETPSLDSVSTQDLYRELLVRIGEDPTRNGLTHTPERMEKSMQFLTRGYAMNVTDVLHDALFDVDYDEMGWGNAFEFLTMEAIEVLPVLGKAH